MQNIEGGGTWTLATETTGGYYPDALTRSIRQPCANPNVANGRGHEQRRHAAKPGTKQREGELKHQVINDVETRGRVSWAEYIDAAVSGTATLPTV